MTRCEQASPASAQAEVLPSRTSRNLSFDPALTHASKQAVTLISYAERKVIFDETHTADAIYQLVSGAVLISRTATSGERQILEIVKPQSYFGLACEAEYDCRAETLMRCIVRRIDRSFADGSPLTQKLLAHQLVRKVADYRAHSGRRSAAERVASLLLSLPFPDDTRARCADERIAITQAEMASLLGLAIETVCRVLRDFKRVGAVSMPRRGRITILDRAALGADAGQ